MGAILTGRRGNTIAFFAADYRGFAAGFVAARIQRPLPFILRQSVDFGVARQVENQAVAAVGFGAQAAPYHLQVQRQAHGGASDYHAGSVGQVEPLGGDGHVDQDAEGSVAE